MLTTALNIVLCMVLDEWFSPLSLRKAKRVIATNTELVPGWARDKAVKVSWGANADPFTRTLRPKPVKVALIPMLMSSL